MICGTRQVEISFETWANGLIPASFVTCVVSRDTGHVWCFFIPVFNTHRGRPFPGTLLLPAKCYVGKLLGS